MYLSKEAVNVRDRALVDCFNDNYEYFYLDSMHYLCEKEEIDTIVTGLSYGMDGIDTKMLSTPALNFSMRAQDLYYDFLHASYAIKNSKVKIKQCIITLGLYSLNYDLSLSSSKYKCVKTYVPLFGDSHHAPKAELGTEGKVWDECRRFAHEFFMQNPSFYGDAITRKHTSVYAASRGGWSNLSKEQRAEYAHNLAEKHNKHIKHKDTFDENSIILKDYIKFLVENEVRPIVLILPFSREYSESISPIYLEKILEVLEGMEYAIDYINMNESDCFDTDDFSDADHLNEKGAAKATALMDAFLTQ